MVVRHWSSLLAEDMPIVIILLWEMLRNFHKHRQIHLLSLAMNQVYTMMDILCLACFDGGDLSGILSRDI